MCIAAAILGAAVIGAVGVGVAGSESASATTSAANTAAGVQRQALGQQAALAAPYTGLGQAAIPEYEALLGIGGTTPAAGMARGGATPGGPAGIQQTLQNLPGYQFAQQQGTQGTEAALNAEGLGLSGNAETALSTFNQGLASENYNQYLQQLLAPIQIGQGAAAGQAANIQTGASNLGNIAIGQGNNLAGIYANEAAGFTKAAGMGANNYLEYQTLQNLGNNPNSAGYWGGNMNPYNPGYGSYQITGYDPATQPGMVFQG